MFSHVAPLPCSYTWSCFWPRVQRLRVSQLGHPGCALPSGHTRWLYHAEWSSTTQFLWICVWDESQEHIGRKPLSASWKTGRCYPGKRRPGAGEPAWLLGCRRGARDREGPACRHSADLRPGWCRNPSLWLLGLGSSFNGGWTPIVSTTVTYALKPWSQKQGIEKSVPHQSLTQLKQPDKKAIKQTQGKGEEGTDQEKAENNKFS